jgi:hypothetical protein
MQRLAMLTRRRMSGSTATKAVEVDEAFFGGKLANMHAWRVQKLREEHPDLMAEGYEVRKDNKAPVVGMFDRATRQVRAKVVKNVKRETLQAEILKNVKYGSAVYTDEAVVHDTLRQKFVHETVNHAETYVNGQVVKVGVKVGQRGGAKVGQWMAMQLLSISWGRASGA